MYQHEEMNDGVWCAVRDSVSEIPLPAARPLEAIVARGRARRHRRTSGVAVTAAAAAIAVAFAIGLPGVGRTQHTYSGGVATGPVRLGTGPVHVELTAYSVNTNTDGTVTVTVTPGQRMDPNAFRQILAQAGVPAEVTVGSFCRTPDQPPGLRQVFQPAGAPDASPGRPTQRSQTTVITPSALPAGAEVSVGYFSDRVAMTLVTVSEQLTCGSGT
jgi:hypothetical protein